MEDGNSDSGMWYTVGATIMSAAMGAASVAKKLIQRRSKAAVRKTRVEEIEPNHQISGMPRPDSLAVTMLLDQFRSNNFRFVRKFGVDAIKGDDSLSDLDRRRLNNMVGASFLRTAGLFDGVSRQSDLEHARICLAEAMHDDDAQPRSLRVSVRCNAALAQLMRGNYEIARRLVAAAGAIDPSDKTFLYCELCVESRSEQRAATLAAAEKLLSCFPEYQSNGILVADPDLCYFRSLPESRLMLSATMGSEAQARGSLVPVATLILIGTALIAGLCVLGELGGLGNVATLAWATSGGCI